MILPIGKVRPQLRIAEADPVAGFLDRSPRNPTISKAGMDWDKSTLPGQDKPKAQEPHAVDRIKHKNTCQSSDMNSIPHFVETG